MAHDHPPPAAPLPPLATAQPPPYPPGRQFYPDYGEEGPYFRPPRRQPDRRPQRCFLCDEEGHFAYRCPARSLLQRLLRQQARETLMALQEARFSSFQQQKQPGLPPGAFKLLGGSPKAKVTPVGCAVGPPITGQLTLEGIPVLGLVDTGASVTCLGFSVWWRYRAQWGPLRQFEGTVHGAHGKPLQIAGKTQHLDLQWGEAHGRACFIVIVGLESPPCLIGMDIMRPLRVRIDVTNGTATPDQPDPQTVHLNTAQSQQRRKILLPGTDSTTVEAACPPKNQQQRKEMPLPEVDLPTVEVACPPQTQSQRMKMPLPEVGSPAVGAASPSQTPQQRKKMPLPEIGPPTMGAAYSSHTQSQRKEMPLPEVEMPAPPSAETSPTATQATARPGEPLSTFSLPAASPYAAAPHAASRALLLQTADIPPETARLVCCHNPWPAEDVLFCPDDALPAFVTGIPALSSVPELWFAIHNHRPESLQLHSGQNIGVLEVKTLADKPPTASRPGPPRKPPLPERLSPLQQQQLNDLFREFSDVFSQGEDDLGSTPLLEHTIETHGPPLRQPYRRQNPAV